MLGSANGKKSRQNRGKKGKTAPLAKDGQVISRSWLITGSMPTPHFTNFNDQIQVTLEATFLAYHSTSATVPTYKGVSLSLTAFTSSAYLGLFDQYRIDQVESWMFPDLGGVVHGGPWSSVIDLDDANTPSASADVQNRQGCLTSGIDAGHYHRWKPHMAVAAYSGAFTSYSNIIAGWIDAASPAVQHYGLKCVWPPTSSGVTTYSLVLRIVVSFKGPGI